MKRTLSVLIALVFTAFSAGLAGAPSALADNYVPISGDGSTWAQNAIQQWVTDVKQYGMRINYNGTGSGQGRNDFLKQTVDYAVSDIPFQTNPTDGSAPEDPGKTPYAYMPIVAGGTAFMYHLTIGGKRVTNLRLSGDNIAKIFTGTITLWSDPAIAKDNPGLTLPAEKIVPVVRSDSSGSSAQFSIWMQQQEPAIWNAYYQKLGKGNAGGETSYWPTSGSMIAQSGDLGVAGYVAQSYGEGSIGYVEYSYALNAGYPVAKMLNKAGYYVEPTSNNVAVALTKAKINNDASNPATYLTQDLSQVYTFTDPRVYPMSSYSYMILPTNANRQNFSTDKGKTLAAFAQYFMCQGQQNAAKLGYSPLPVNLVMAGLEQIEKVPGETVLPAGKQVGLSDVKGCNNPTLDPSNPGSNLLAKKAPMPQACDKQGTLQCTTGTGGDTDPTPVKASAQGGGSTAPSSAPPASGHASTGTPAPGTSTGAPAPGATTGAPAPGGTTGAPAPGATTGAPAPGATDSGGAVQDPNAAVSDPNAAPVAQDVVAVPVSVSTANGWSGQQTLIVVVVVVVLGLLVGPPLLARRLKRGGK